MFPCTGLGRSFCTFEPYDQTRLEMSWGSMMVETGKMTGKVKGKMSEKFLAAIRKNAGITIAELATIVGVTDRTIERNIQRLQAENLLRRIGSRKKGHWEVVGD